MLGGKKSNNKKVEKLRTIFIKYLNLIEMKIIIQLNKFIKCTFGYTNIDLIYLYF
ncbi:hypothetical protein [Clostridioides difficile]|uniref:hypothetical protein n=1 Tax=Clostridioides difficile TaxID=1496 RepID=UPI0013EFB4F4|nr:hypothetical protein [Clostridioides difficile]